MATAPVPSASSSRSSSRPLRARPCPSVARRNTACEAISAADFLRCVRRAIDDLCTAVGDCAIPLLPHRPVERGIRVTEVAGARRKCLGVEPSGLPQRAANANPFELIVFVAGIGHGCEHRCFADCDQFRAAPTQQRTDQREVAAGNDRRTLDSCKATDAGAAGEPHHEGLCLIIELMTGRDRSEPSLLRPLGEQAITVGAGLLLDGALRLRDPLDGQDVVRNAEVRA